MLLGSTSGDSDDFSTVISLSHVWISGELDDDGSMKRKFEGATKLHCSRNLIVIGGMLEGDCTLLQLQIERMIRRAQPGRTSYI